MSWKEKEKKKNNTKFSSHYVQPPHAQRAPATLRSHQFKPHILLPTCCNMNLAFFWPECFSPTSRLARTVKWKLEIKMNKIVYLYHQTTDILPACTQTCESRKPSRELYY